MPIPGDLIVKIKTKPKTINQEISRHRLLIHRNLVNLLILNKSHQKEFIVYLQKLTIAEGIYSLPSEPDYTSIL